MLWIVDSGGTDRRLGIVVAVTTLVVAAFLVGRATTPSETHDQPPLPEFAECRDFSRSGIVMPGSTLGWYTSCRWHTEMARIVAGGDPTPIEIYAEEDDQSAVAWYYFDCGMPDGFVDVGASHPDDCGVTGTPSRGGEAARSR